MTNKEIALVMLNGMIAGMENGSSIPVQLSELKTLKLLLENLDSAKPKRDWQPAAFSN